MSNHRKLSLVDICHDSGSNNCKKGMIIFFRKLHNLVNIKLEKQLVDTDNITIRSDDYIYQYDDYVDFWTFIFAGKYILLLY